MKSKEVSECKGYLKIEVVNNSQLLSSLNGDENFMKSYINSYKHLYIITNYRSLTTETNLSAGPWVDRVYNRKSVTGFLSFEPFEFGIFWNLHQPKGGCPPLTFHPGF